jgi:arylsulfatase A-like enzyme
MKRREFLKTAALGALSVGLAGRGRVHAAEPSKPNIVYVFADQHRHCSWPGGGDPQVKTPNLEALARDGLTFNHCVSNHPLCSPYRASLLTGRYQQAHTVAANVGGNHGSLPTTEATIADVLKKAGYATGYVGKWHLYPGSVTGKVVPPGPHRHGFDWWRACHNYRKRYDTRYYDDNGKEIVLPDYAPKCQMDLTLEFIEKNAEKPFCVFLSWHPPHSPYGEAPKRFGELYSPDHLKLRLNVPKDADTRKLREDHVGYFSHVSALDEEMGRLMRKLAELGIAENTIVCYSSDHGDMLGSFDLKAKNKPWNESIEVPFVVRWPAGLPKGKRLETLFSTVDITPTLLGLAGVPVLPQMQGADLSALLKGNDAPGPESAFIMGGGALGLEEDEAGGGEGEEPEGKTRKEEKRGKGKKKVGSWRGVRTARFTYAKHGTGGDLEPWLLYDNEKDPFQMRNLVEEAEQAQTCKELDAMLSAWRKRVGET